ncbi:MAG: hypothetical protein JNJ54_10935 [Myxococcaceae bacterium]|nr:hypothetical protein [Myxococcaceae bacterium]
MLARTSPWIAAVVALLAPVTGHTNAADGGVALDATVERSNGSTTRLGGLWAKPTVLFYEDRDSTALNEHVKAALADRARDGKAQQQVMVVAVANVAAWDWFPARNFVLAAVKDIEKKVNQPVYLDFKGSLSAAPWSLPSKTSSVLVLDRSGHPTWRAEGRLPKEKVDELFKELERLVAQ